MNGIHGVKIGDKFKNGKHTICEVRDILECKSMYLGTVIKHICLAKAVDGSLSTNTFEVPFATVMRNKI